MNQAQRRQAAALLLDKRKELSCELAALVSAWPKYTAQYAGDREAFAETESAALVDYLASYLRDGDVAFRHLYIGEKAKQFHDPATAAEERRRREAVVLDGERRIFIEALRSLPEASMAATEAFDAIHAALTGEAAHELRVLFIGDCVYLDVIAFLTAPALADGIRLVPRFVASHDVMEIQSALAGLAKETFDLVFLSPFTYAFLPDYEALQRPRMMLHRETARRHADEAVRIAETIFDTAADLFECPIVAHLPAPLFRHDGTIRDRVREWVTRPPRARAIGPLRRSLTDRALGRSRAGQPIMLLDEAELVAETGLHAAGRYFHRLTLQHPARFGALVAERYRDILLAAAKLLKRKLVVCDLDETLWEGIIGEGLGVKHHYDRQETLLELKERGIVLAINSKNDPAKVVWEAAPGGLALDHFVSRQISWDPKTINMRRIAEHLNLKEKDFVFIDDRADERAMIGEAYPAILTLDACDPRSWRLLGIWAELLPRKPGADRTEFYRQRDAREAFISAEAETSVEQRAAAYAKLALKLSIRNAASDDVARVTDLINRTNQFNMTGGRVTRRQVEEWLGSNDARLLVADAEDRFGSMGTVAALAVTRDEVGLTLPVFVLSCRVFGYGMEYPILAEALRLAAPGIRVFGPFSETEHNQPCRDVYPNAGFSAVSGGWAFDPGVNPLPSSPGWLTVDADVRLFGDGPE